MKRIDPEASRRPVDVESYPLSPLQQGMLFNALREPESGVDVEQVVCYLGESLAPGLLKQSWAHAMERHALLRTNLRWKDCLVPHQEVQREVPLPWQEESRPALSDEEREAALNRFLVEDRARGFDLASAPLFRLTLLHHGHSSLHLVWTIHHAVIDGRSFEIVLSEVFEYYEALRRCEKCALPQPKPFRDYVEWLRLRDPGEDEAFWRDALKGFTAPTPLAIDHSPLASLPDGFRKGSIELSLPRITTSKLREIALAGDFRLSTLVQGCWAMLLSRYSGESDVVFGVIRANRQFGMEHAPDTVGLFVNTLPFRVQVDPDAELLPWLRRVRQNWVKMREHAHASLSAIQQWSDVLTGGTVFHSTLMFEHLDLETRMRKQGDAWSNRRIRIHSQTSFPLDVAAYDGDSLRLRIDFDRMRIDEPDAHRILGHLITLLQGIADNPGQRVGDVPLLTEAELRQIRDWNATKYNYATGALLHEMFEERARHLPQRTKLVFEGEHVTNAVLDARANQLAHFLQGSGVGTETLVAICVERSIEMVVGILGVLKSGGAYVPLDPDLPPERVAAILSETQAPIVLTQRGLRERFASGPAKVVCLDSDSNLIATHPVSSPPRRATPDSLAYVIYTSGSTGRPKGVMVTHAAICNHMHWVKRVHPLSDQDVELQKTPLGFDASVWELFASLVTDAQLVIARPDGHLDPSYLAETIKRHGVSSLQVVPSQLRQLLDEPTFKECGNSLQRVYCGGEALGRDLRDAFLASFPGTRLFNMYGPTEATIDATWWACAPNEREGAVLIGKPIDNARAYIVDARMRLVPVGVSGELLIGGIGLARGYLGNVEATAERFLPDPFCTDEGARIYKTGDRARYKADGNIDFLGRVDHQVKIRGIRIEPGEIEATLAGHPGVHEALVVAHEFSPDDVRLVAYIATDRPTPDLTERLRDLLRARLPEYMIPAYFIHLSSLPLTPIGKVDRARLPVPQQSSIDGLTYVAPGTPVEKALAAIWREVLQLDHIGIKDDFFALGGHSLLLARLISKINALWRTAVGVPQLIQNPTIERMARLIADQSPDRLRLSAVVPLNEGNGGIPVYFIYAGPGEFRTARNMGNAHPVFGVEAQWPVAWRTALSEKRVSEFPTMEQMVAPYVAALREHAGSTPCVLAGFSYAGLIAFEAAHQLKKAGGKLELVILVDSQAEPPKPHKLAWQTLRRGWEQPTRESENLSRLERLTMRLTRSWELVAWLSRKVIAKLAGLFRRPEPDLETLTGVLDEKGMPLPWGLLDRLYGEIDKTYQPRILDCRGVLLRTDEIDGRRIASPDDTLGWGKIFSRGLDVIPLAGNHYSIFGEQIPTIAHEIGRILEHHGLHRSEATWVDKDKP